MNTLRIVLVFFRLGTMAELAYRANFWFQLLESFFTLSIVLGLVAVVTSQTETLGGWNQGGLVIIAGVYFIVFSVLNVVVAPSLSRFIEDVRMGTLDFTLIKPQDAQLLVCISQFQFWKLIDLVLGVAVLVYGVHLRQIDVSATDVMFFVGALLSGMCVAFSFWMMLATLAFWFVRIENILQIFWMVYSAGRWPVGIYPGWLRFVLTALVPVAVAVTLPAEALTGRLDATGLLQVMLGAAVSLVISRAFWKFGLRHYSGASA